MSKRYRSDVRHSNHAENKTSIMTLHCQTCNRMSTKCDVRRISCEMATLNHCNDHDSDHVWTVWCYHVLACCLWLPASLKLNVVFEEMLWNTASNKLFMCPVTGCSSDPVRWAEEPQHWGIWWIDLVHSSPVCQELPEYPCQSCSSSCRDCQFCSRQWWSHIASPSRDSATQPRQRWNHLESISKYQQQFSSYRPNRRWETSTGGGHTVAQTLAHKLHIRMPMKPRNSLWF